MKSHATRDHRLGKPGSDPAPAGRARTRSRRRAVAAMAASPRSSGLSSLPAVVTVQGRLERRKRIETNESGPRHYGDNAPGRPRHYGDSAPGRPAAARPPSRCIVDDVPARDRTTPPRRGLPAVHGRHAAAPPGPLPGLSFPSSLPSSLSARSRAGGVPARGETTPSSRS